jgi:hypothetical protein
VIAWIGFVSNRPKRFITTSRGTLLRVRMKDAENSGLTQGMLPSFGLGACSAVPHSSVQLHEPRRPCGARGAGCRVAGRGPFRRSARRREAPKSQPIDVSRLLRQVPIFPCTTLSRRHLLQIAPTAQFRGSRQLVGSLFSYKSVSRLLHPPGQGLAQSRSTGALHTDVVETPGRERAVCVHTRSLSLARS